MASFSPRDEREAYEADERDVPSTRSLFKRIADVSRVLATAKGPRPEYRLTGKELYVRARVTSSKHHGL